MGFQRTITCAVRPTPAAIREVGLDSGIEPISVRRASPGARMFSPAALAPMLTVRSDARSDDLTLDLTMGINWALVVYLFVVL